MFLSHQGSHPTLSMVYMRLKPGLRLPASKVGSPVTSKLSERKLRRNGVWVAVEVEEALQGGEKRSVSDTG